MDANFIQEFYQAVWRVTVVLCGGSIVGYLVYTEKFVRYLKKNKSEIYNALPKRYLYMMYPFELMKVDLYLLTYARGGADLNDAQTLYYSKVLKILLVLICLPVILLVVGVLFNLPLRLILTP